MKCAECDCENGDEECNWIASGPGETWVEIDEVQEAAKVLLANQDRLIAAYGAIPKAGVRTIADIYNVLENLKGE